MKFDVDTSGSGSHPSTVCECSCKATELCRHHVRIFQNQRLSRWRHRPQQQRRSKCSGAQQATLDNCTSLAYVDLPSFISSQILLKQSSFRWDFDIFCFNRCTANRSLFHLGWHLFNHYQLIEEFHLDSMKLCHTLYLIEQLYHSCNFYHNALHAADVAQAMHCFIKDDVLAAALSKLDIAACIMAALCHDLDHPGRTAAFLTASDHLLSKLYAQEGSILERHHWFTTRSLLYETGLFAHEFVAPLVDQLYVMIEDMILATDMSQHASFMEQLRQHQVKNQLHPSSTADVSLKLQLSLGASEEEKRLALRLTLKCADICNPARPWPQCRSWAELIVDEFFAQGDAEQLVGRACSPLMNRRTDKLAKIQTGFIKFVVDPLFALWHSWLQSDLSQCVFDHVIENLKLWEVWDQMDTTPSGYVWPFSNDFLSKDRLQRQQHTTSAMSRALKAATTTAELSPLSEEVSGGGGLFKASSFVDEKTVDGAAHGRRHSLPMASLLPAAAASISRRRGSSSNTSLTRIANRQHTAALIARCQQKDKMLLVGTTRSGQDEDDENGSGHDSRNSSSDESAKDFILPQTLTHLNQRRGSAPTPTPLANWSESLVRVVVQQQHQLNLCVGGHRQQRQRSSSVDLVCADVNTRNFFSSLGMFVSLQSCVSQAGSIHSNTSSREAGLNEV